MARSDRAAARLTMGPGAVLSLSEAAAMLPVKDSDARRWLRRFARDLDGRPVIVWADVIDALRSGDTPTERDATPTVVRVPRVRLDPL